MLYRCDKEMAAELIWVLGEYSCTWGTPEELARDGGSTYMVASTQRFLASWAV